MARQGETQAKEQSKSKTDGKLEKNTANGENKRVL